MIGKNCKMVTRHPRWDEVLVTKWLRDSLRSEIIPHPLELAFLWRCFRYVTVDMAAHAIREQLPDEGFESRFRESCYQNLHGWSISESREFRLGARLETASGVGHEIDIVVSGVLDSSCHTASYDFLAEMPVQERHCRMQSQGC